MDPNHVNAIGCGTAGDVYRCLYEWQDQGRVFSIKVCQFTQSIIFPYGTEHDTQVVVKVFQSGPEEYKKVEQRIMREVAAWRHLEHPNVSQFLGVAYLRPNRPPGLVSLYLRHNDLLAFVGENFDKKVQKVWTFPSSTAILHLNDVLSGKRDCMWLAISTYYESCTWGHESCE